MEPGLVSHARMCSAQVVAGPTTRSSEAPAATPLSSMRIVCVGVIPVLSPAWRCAGSLCITAVVSRPLFAKRGLHAVER